MHKTTHFSSKKLVYRKANCFVCEGGGATGNETAIRCCRIFCSRFVGCFY